MLTGVSTKSRSLTSSTSTVGERSKDALGRINELIRQSSVQDVEDKTNDEVFHDNDHLLSSTDQNHRRRSDDLNPIQFYINETNKLTNNLEKSINEQTNAQQDKRNVTNLDDINIQQVNNLSLRISKYLGDKIITFVYF
jgi:hypothetical protein